MTYKRSSPGTLGYGRRKSIIVRLHSVSRSGDLGGNFVDILDAYVCNTFTREQ